MEVYRNKVDKTISRIVLSLSNVTFDIELRGYITVIEGKSNTGKTFFLTSLKNHHNNNSNLFKEYGIQNVLLFNSMSLDLDILSSLESVNKSLILIDNADTLLSGNLKLLEFISLDRDNQYIIVSRGGVNLPVTPNHYCELVEDNKRIFTKYNCTVNGWL